MAFTNFSKKSQAGNTEPFVAVFTVSGDNTYPTGGTAAFTAFVQNNCNGATPLSAHGFATDGSHTAEYNAVTDKLMVFDTAIAAEAMPSDLSAKTFQITVIGK